MRISDWSSDVCSSDRDNRRQRWRRTILPLRVERVLRYRLQPRAGRFDGDAQSLDLHLGVQPGIEGEPLTRRQVLLQPAGQGLFGYMVEAVQSCIHLADRKSVV